VTSAAGFIIGLALFGAVTFLPLYLQVVKGHSPTVSGLLLTPMMGGLLITVHGRARSWTGDGHAGPGAGRAERGRIPLPGGSPRRGRRWGSARASPRRVTTAPSASSSGSSAPCSSARSASASRRT
jgi:hypothetical protein